MGLDLWEWGNGGWREMWASVRVVGGLAGHFELTSEIYCTECVVDKAWVRGLAIAANSTRSRSRRSYGVSVEC